MRVLLVVHDFLPAHPSGTEIYTWQLGRELARRGHDVQVFTTEKEISRPNLTVHLREYGGLPVHELTNNLFYNDFRGTWDYPPAARSFGLFLDDLRPDVVHFMHLLYLSVGCVEEAARRSLPVVFTLHDYWLQCARFGQRVHAAGTICHQIHAEACGQCLASFKFRQTRVERAGAKALAALRGATGIDAAPPARRLASLLKARSTQRGRPQATAPGATEPPAAESLSAAERALAGEVRERERALRERLVPAVDAFIAPSRFLRERFLEWGLPEQQVRAMRNGIDVAPFTGLRRERSEKLRVAFIGTLAPHKGVHVLLEAWAALPPELAARGELTVWGPFAHNPGYLLRLGELAARSGAKLAGGLARADVPAALARTDLLVVPSVWYENSPLIIMEALACGTALAVSDLGGMAELVEEGVGGFHFRVGDSADLARVLARLLADRAVLDGLAIRAGAVHVRRIEDDAAEIEALYAEAARARAARRGDRA